MKHYGRLLLAGAFFLALLNFAFLHFVSSGDESRVAGIAAEMALSGDWFLPRLNGTPFLEYPFGAYLLMALSYTLFGITDLAAKIPSMLAFCGSVCLTFLTGRNCGCSRRTALLSAAFLAFMPAFWINAANCRVDMILSFFITLAFYGWSCNLNRSTIKGWFWFITGMTGGFLTKGPIGFCVPLAAAGVWTLVRDCKEKHFSWSRYFGFAGALLCVLGAAGLYVWYIQAELGAAGVEQLLMVNGIGRFSGSQGDHVLPWWWYLSRGEFLQPFLILALTGIFFVFCRKKFRKGELFMLCMLIVPFAALCVASAKRSVYLLPLCVPGVLLAADAFMKLWLYLRRRCHWNFRFILKYCLLLLGAGAVMLCATGWHKMRKQESLAPLFAEWQRLEKSGKKIALYSPTERLSGGAVFHLKRLAPVYKENGGFEYVVIRSRDELAGYKNMGDDHYIVPVSTLKKR